MLSSNVLSKNLRRVALTLSIAAASGLAANVQAADEIVLGGSLPLTGPFGFAGVMADKGLEDYIAYVNANGGISGRKLRYVKEDTGWKVDASVSAFNRITNAEKVNLYYGDSTGFQKTINNELTRRGDILMAGTSFATVLNDPENFPYQFIPGPDYSQMVGILLKHIAKEKPKAKVAFMYADSEFGRDPIEPGVKLAVELGLDVVDKIVTPHGNVDVTGSVLQLRRSQPDYLIFHGYVLQPIPEVITQARQMGLKTQYMGTFWSMDSGFVKKMGEAGHGFMGVVPYQYLDDPDTKGKMVSYILEKRGGPQPVYYTQTFLATMLMVESVKRTLDAGKELNGANLKAAFSTIKDFDTGGLVGVPISVDGNSIPIGRVYRADAASGLMLPVSDWIYLK